MVKENIVPDIETFEMQGVNWQNNDAPVKLAKFIAKSTKLISCDISKQNNPIHIKQKLDLEDVVEIEESKSADQQPDDDQIKYYRGTVWAWRNKNQDDKISQQKFPTKKQNKVDIIDDESKIRKSDSTEITI